MHRTVRTVTGTILAVLLLSGGCATSSGAEGGGAVNSRDSNWLPVAGSPMRGPQTAKVTVVHFGDLLCEVCAQTAERVRELQKSRADVRVVFYYFPAQRKPNRLAARAAAYAERQGRFWAYYDEVIDRRKEVLELPRVTLMRIGNDVGLDGLELGATLERFIEKGRDLPDRVEDDLRRGRRLGIGKTPAVFVNGRLLATKKDFERLPEVAQSTREQADQLLERGLEPAKLYRGAAAINFREQELGTRKPYRGRLRAHRQTTSTGKPSGSGSSPNASTRVTHAHK